VTKFVQNFLRRHLKENGMLKILAACHLGAPFQSGALRTCVPCRMVNPALSEGRRLKIGENWSYAPPMKNFWLRHCKFLHQTGDLG